MIKSISKRRKFIDFISTTLDISIALKTRHFSQRRFVMCSNSFRIAKRQRVKINLISEISQSFSEVNFHESDENEQLIDDLNVLFSLVSFRFDFTSSKLSRISSVVFVTSMSEKESRLRSYFISESSYED